LAVRKQHEINILEGGRAMRAPTDVSQFVHPPNTEYNKKACVNFSHTGFFS